MSTLQVKTSSGECPQGVYYSSCLFGPSRDLQQSHACYTCVHMSCKESAVNFLHPETALGAPTYGIHCSAPDVRTQERACRLPTIRSRSAFLRSSDNTAASAKKAPGVVHFHLQTSSECGNERCTEERNRTYVWHAHGRVFSAH